MLRILFTLGIVAPLCVATSLGEEPQRGTEYRVTWEFSEYIFPAPGSSAPPSSTENQWNMYYRHLRTGNVVSSAVDRIDYKHQEKGGRGLQLFIDRDTYFNESGQPPRTTTFLREERPHWFEPIGKPLLDVKVDEEGTEVSRESKVNPGGSPANTLISRNIALTRLFHACFPTEKNEWESPTTFILSVSEVRGKLHYKKINEMNGIVKVAVGGKLTSKGLNGNTVQGIFEVTGVQSFDLRQNAWVSGKLNMQAEFKNFTQTGFYTAWIMPIVFTLVSGPDAIMPIKP